MEIVSAVQAQEKPAPKVGANIANYSQEQLRVREILKKRVSEVWGDSQFQYLDYIMDHESDYVLTAQNPYSDACGLGQFIPCNRYGSSPSDLHKHRSAERQVEDVIRYIKERKNYKTPYQAYLFKIANGWY